jgi:molybdenum cofactor synthesis domain-containing protein
MTIRFGILTISDRSARGQRADLSGPALSKEIDQNGWQVAQTLIIPDEQPQIMEILVDWCDQKNLDVILTTGGTGFSPRDVTPEATLSVIQRNAPGIAEAMRLDSLKITPHAMLSRAVAGIRGKTLIINLPGSPKGALENLHTVIPVITHAVDLLQDKLSAESGHLRPDQNNFTR